MWNAVERVGAAGLALILAPLFAFLAITILVLSRRPPFVTHTRAGRFGQPFRMLKFRTMWGQDLASDVLPDIKPLDDPRVTSRFARRCRCYSLDELPQLLHVVSGTMALVGPRPLTRREFELHYGKDSAEILTARPGLTGLWQVMGRSRLTYRQRRRLDLFLVRHPSVSLRARILLRTIPQVFEGKNAW
jgi:exopolysaccharide production protein ExoY